MTAWTDICWQHFYKGDGTTPGFVLPVRPSFGALILTGMRLHSRHKSAMQEARRCAEQMHKP